MFSSIVSTAIALFLCSAIASLIGQRGSAVSQIEGTAQVCLFALPLCLVAWFFALPMVLPEGRFFGGIVGMFLYGCSVGPLVFYLSVMALAFITGGPNLTSRVVSALAVFEAFHGVDPWLHNMMLFAASISAATTVLYLASLRYHQRIQSPTL